MKNLIMNKNLILFLDAATPIFYIAVKDIETGRIIEKKYNNTEIRGEALLHFVQELFRVHGYDVRAIKYLCTTQGPGSLTGLRICMSVLKTLAQILSTPIVCLPTLKAFESSYLTKQSTEKGPILTALIARRDHYYLKRSNEQETCFETVTREQLERQLEEHQICLWSKNSPLPQLCDNQRDKFVIVELECKSIFDLCAVKYAAGDLQDYKSCFPEYSGKSVAEKRFDEKNKPKL